MGQISSPVRDNKEFKGFKVFKDLKDLKDLHTKNLLHFSTKEEN
jgi:hypothetical protein